MANYLNSVPRPLAQKLGEFPSVLDFGAKGNAVADDTAAIRNAINALEAGGGTLFVPPGTYLLSGAINPTGKPNVAIIGAGRGFNDFTSSPVVFKAAPGYFGDLFTATGCPGLRLENLSFMGPGIDSASGGRVAILLGAGYSNNQSIVVRNVLIQDAADDGLYIDTPILSVLDNVKALRCALNGIHLRNGTSVSLISCFGITCSRGGCFHLDGMSYCSLHACAAEVGGIAYWLTNCQNIALIGCGGEDQIRRMASPKSWAPGTVYAVGDIVVPAATYNRALAGYGGNSHVYRCAVAGTSGSFEPTWPLDVNQTVADGTITWQEAGVVGDAYVIENSHHCTLLSPYSRQVDGHHFVFRGANSYLNSVIAPRSWQPRRPGRRVRRSTAARRSCRHRPTATSTLHRGLKVSRPELQGPRSPYGLPRRGQRLRMERSPGKRAGWSRRKTC